MLSVPIYLYFLGAESFGIVGLYVSIQAFFGLMDFGLPITANRQISVLRATNGSGRDIAKLVRAFEIIILAVALIGAGLSAAAAPWISENWLNPVMLSPATISIALMMAGGSAALRFPCAFYANVLFAFDRHLAPNVVSAIAAYTRVILAVVLLSLFEPSLELFFISQLIVNGIELVALQFMAWRGIGGAALTAPDWQQFKKSIGLTVSLSLISLTAFALSQIDKLILTKLLPLTEFGIYSVAYALAMGILPLSYSIGNAIFPELSRLKAKAVSRELGDRLSKALRLTLVLVGPAATFLITQSNGYEGVLGLFTPEARAVSLLLPLLAAGSLFQAFVVLPHAYRIAAGEPQYILWINAALIFPYGIFVYFGAQEWGLVGACWAFIAMNCCSALLHYYYLRNNLLWTKHYAIIIASLLFAVFAGFGLSGLDIPGDVIWWRFTLAVVNSSFILAAMYWFLLRKKIAHNV